MGPTCLSSPALVKCLDEGPFYTYLVVMSKVNPKPTDYNLVSMSANQIRVVKRAIKLAMDASHYGYVDSLKEKDIVVMRNIMERLTQHERTSVHED